MVTRARSVREFKLWGARDCHFKSGAYLSARQAAPCYRYKSFSALDIARLETFAGIGFDDPTDEGPAKKDVQQEDRDLLLGPDELHGAFSPIRTSARDEDDRGLLHQASAMLLARACWSFVLAAVRSRVHAREHLQREREAARRMNAKPGDRIERKWMLSLLVLGAAIRLALWWRNPSDNSFDDHYLPVSLILQTGEIPNKLACFQCYHPPVFYVLSAAVATVLLGVGATPATTAKALQLLNCALGIGTLGVVYAILRRLPVSTFGRLVSFSLIVFLPRHMYMSAMYANDAAAGFFATLSAYLAIRLLQGADGWIMVLLLAVTVTAAIFTKYTALAVLPMIAMAVVLALASVGWNRPRAVRHAMALLLPLVILGAAMASHSRTYGSVLPDNTPLYSPVTRPPRDNPAGVTYTTFEPWRFVAHPFLRPGQLSSFWTLLYAGMWFDTEPRFAPFLGDQRGWVEYFAWLDGEGPYREAPAPTAFMHLASALEVLGLFWLAIGLTGVFEFVRRLLAKPPTADPPSPEIVPLVVLLAFTLAGVAYFAVKLPVYSALKASYLLGALPAFAALTALGAERWERWRLFKGVAGTAAAAYAALVVVHVAYWVWSMRVWRP